MPFFIRVMASIQIQYVFHCPSTFLCFKFSLKFTKQENRISRWMGFGCGGVFHESQWKLESMTERPTDYRWHGDLILKSDLAFKRLNVVCWQHWGLFHYKSYLQIIRSLQRLKGHWLQRLQCSSFFAKKKKAQEWNSNENDVVWAW